jgi:hypothetical protein
VTNQYINSKFTARPLAGARRVAHHLVMAIDALPATPCERRALLTLPGAPRLSLSGSRRCRHRPGNSWSCRMRPVMGCR